MALRKMTEIEIERDTLKADKELRESSIENTIAQTKVQNATSINHIEAEFKTML